MTVKQYELAANSSHLAANGSSPATSKMTPEEYKASKTVLSYWGSEDENTMLVNALF